MNKAKCRPCYNKALFRSWDFSPLRKLPFVVGIQFRGIPISLRFRVQHVLGLLQRGRICFCENNNLRRPAVLTLGNETLMQCAPQCGFKKARSTRIPIHQIYVITLGGGSPLCTSQLPGEFIWSLLTAWPQVEQVIQLYESRGFRIDLKSVKSKYSGH